MADELLIDGAMIWAGPGAAPQAGHLAVRDGVIVALGSGPAPHAAERRALGGMHVLPGFVDAHSHLTVSAWLPHALDASGWDSAVAALAAIARHRAQRPAGSWIVALGADSTDGRNGRSRTISTRPPPGTRR